MCIKYTIEQCNKYSRTLWVVKSEGKVISHHESRSEASMMVQRYINEDLPLGAPVQPFPPAI